MGGGLWNGSEVRSVLPRWKRQSVTASLVLSSAGLPRALSVPGRPPLSAPSASLPSWPLSPADPSLWHCLELTCGGGGGWGSLQWSPSASFVCDGTAAGRLLLEAGVVAPRVSTGKAGALSAHGRGGVRCP